MNVFGSGNRGVQAGYINNFHSHTVEPDDSEYRCLRSLAFRTMYIKSGDKERVAGSGDWIFDHERYQQWQNNGGILWIRGRAGCGKSMLMKHIVAKQVEDKPKADGNAIMSFSFRRDGEELQRSAAGVFRSLLHQLLSNDAELYATFKADTNFDERCAREGQAGDKWDWSESVLRKELSKTLLHRFKGGRRARIYLDALDESGEDVTTLLICYFRKVSEASNGNVSVCFSARPYAFVNAQYDFAINAEEHNREDMKLFLADQFLDVAQLITPEDARSITDGLISRASSVFQWLAWVHPRVVKLVLDGEPVGHVLNKIKGYPQELGQVYEDILRSVEDTDVEQTLRMFEWLTLATRPLLLDDLRVAVCLETGKRHSSIEELQSSDHWCSGKFQGVDRLVTRAARLSQGLIRAVAVTQLEASESEDSEIDYIFQFDHQSVQEFMAQKGLRMLFSRFSASTSSFHLVHRHLEAAQKCLDHLLVKEIGEFSKIRQFNVVDLGPIVINSGNSELFEEDPPFAMYAARQWLEHLKMAVPDRAFLEDVIDLLAGIPVDAWSQVATMWEIEAHNICSGDRTGTTLVHILCAGGLHSVLQPLLTRGDPATLALHARFDDLREACQKQINVRNADSQSPLWVAAQRGHCNIVDVLIRHGAHINAPSSQEYTPLHIAAQCGHEDVVRSLLANEAINVDAKRGFFIGCRRNALCDAVTGQHIAVVKLLLPRSKLGVHSRAIEFEGPGRDWPLCTPLCVAMLSGNPELLRVLLTCDNLDGKMQDDRGRSMLHYMTGDTFTDRHSAALRFEMIRILIESGKMALDLSDNDGRTPLSMAAETGRADLVHLLLTSSEVDVGAQDVRGLTPLVYAIHRGRTNTAQMLLNDVRVSLHDTDEVGRLPLQLAVVSGNLEMVKLLLATGRFSVLEPMGSNESAAAGAIAAMVCNKDNPAERRSIAELLMKCSMVALSDTLVALPEDDLAQAAAKVLDEKLQQVAGSTSAYASRAADVLASAVPKED